MVVSMGYLLCFLMLCKEVSSSLKVYCDVFVPDFLNGWILYQMNSCHLFPLLAELLMQLSLIHWIEGCGFPAEAHTFCSHTPCTMQSLTHCRGCTNVAEAVVCTCQAYHSRCKKYRPLLLLHSFNLVSLLHIPYKSWLEV